MRKCKGFVVALAAMVLIVGMQAGTQVGAQVAEAPEAAPAQPKIDAAAALKQIPSGCVGFAIVNNINGLAGKIDKFIAAVSPTGMPPGGGVLDQLLMASRLGPGLNRNGPIAAVVLDPQLYGFDILRAIGLGKPAAEGDELVVKPEFPVVLIIPGKNPAVLLAAQNPVKDGKFFRTDDGGVWIEKNGFIIGGPNKKAVEAVVATEKSIVGDLSATDLALIRRNDAAVWINVKTVSPIVDSILAALGKKIEAEAKKVEVEGGAGGAPLSVTPLSVKGMTAMLNMYGVMLKEIQDLSLGLRFIETGVIIENRTTFTPAGLMAKALAAVKPDGGALLSRLPNMPYAIALGARGLEAMPADLITKMFQTFLATDMLKGMSKENKDKLLAQAKKMLAQTTGVQIYAGSITSGDGLAGLSYVLECKSAKTLRALIGEYIPMVSEIYQAMPEDLRATLEYVKGDETLAGGKQKVDIIKIQIPAMANMDEDDLAKLKAILGETELRMRMAEAGENALVLTLGGGKSFLAEAVKAAKAGAGKLAADPAMVKSLALLPRKRTAVMATNLGNIMTLVAKIMAATGMQIQPPPATAIATEPLVASISVDRGDMHIVGYIPTKTIKETVQGAMMLIMSAVMQQGGGMMGPMPGPGPQPVPGPDF